MPDRTPLAPLAAPSDDPVPGATLVIEAPTAEAALAELHDRLGGDARIVEVRRVARGGIGGFFARELVELHAAPGDGAPPTTEIPAAAPAAASPSAAGTSPIERLLAADAPEAVDFATYLRRQTDAAPVAPTEPAASTHEALLERAAAAARAAVASSQSTGGGIVDPATGRVPGSPEDASSPADAPATVVTAAPVADPVAAPVADPVAVVETAESTVVADTAIDEPTASREPGPIWSVANLVKLGLPAGLVRGLEVAAPEDDVAWTAALAGALRPVCRPLPSGRSLLVGPRARSVASGIGAPVTAVGQPIRSRASTVAAAVGSGAASRRWLERVRGTRWLHLVVGGAGWRPLLELDPLAVSWATVDDVPEAVRLATELGLVLGAGPIGGRVQRARPLDVALAVRELLPVRS